ncbi:cytidyltransferase domain protein [Ostertagia ostertagi]
MEKLVERVHCGAAFGFEDSSLRRLHGNYVTRSRGHCDGKKCFGSLSGDKRAGLDQAYHDDSLLHVCAPDEKTRYQSSAFLNFDPSNERTTTIPKDRPVHIFTEGIYDLFHYGHVRQLKQVKEAFPDVIVTAGVCSNELVCKYKGGPLVMTFEERFTSVAECKYVDRLNYFHADLIAHDGAPYAGIDGEDCFKPFKELDRFLPTQR